MISDLTPTERLQDLFVRLLFCDETFARYRADPSALTADFGLDPSVADDLPAPDTAQLVAERQGRKTGVLREITGVFVQSYPLIESLPGYRIDDFLCSDSFFGAGTGLPHPFGSGVGYENASKFYFWARRSVDFDSAPAGAQARFSMQGDFASYLVGQSGAGSDDYYRRFAAGIYWRERRAEPLPVIYMSPQRDVYRILERQQSAALRTGGAFDLDKLRPEPAPSGGNIR